MAVARNLRTYPLSLKTTAAYSLNNGIVAAYDYVGDPNNSYAGGDGAPHVGSKTLTKDADAVFPVVTVSPEILGRDLSNGKTSSLSYRGMSIGPLGFGTADGKAAFTLHHRYRTPSAGTLTSSGTRLLAVYADGGGTKITLTMYESTTGYVYFYWVLGGATVPASAGHSNTALRLPFNAIVDLHLVSDGTTVYAYQNGVMISSGAAPSLDIKNTAYSGGAAGTRHGFNSATYTDLILIDHAIWNRTLSGPEVTQHYNDPYAGYNNTAVVAPGIKITGPVPNDTVSSEGFNVNLTWSGSTAPTSIQGQFNGGTWYTIVANPTGGSAVGVMPAVPAGTGELKVRFSNNTAITDSITLTAAPPVPTVGLVSQSAPDGQSLTLQISVQRVNSLVIDLIPVANGAVPMSHTLAPAYSTSAATVLDTFTGIEPGDYSVSIKGTNTSGETVIGGNVFTILGVGGGGSGPGDAPAASAPGAPTGVTATAGNGFILFSFTPPASNGGAEITEYRVTTSTGQTASGEASPIRVSVPNGTAATGTVAAKNTVGYGPESAASSAVTPTPTIPGAPRNVNAQALGGAMAVTFIVPLSDGGSPILSYIVTSSTGQTATGSSSPIVINSEDGVAASAVVRAVNAIGPGPDSAPSNTVTPASLPGLPVILSVTARNGYVLAEVAPPEFDGGFPVDGYRITASTGQTADGTDSPIRINLPRDVTVTLTAMAHTNAGYGEPSEPSAPVTPRAPFITVKLTSVSNQAIQNIGGLSYAWFDQTTPDAFTQPTQTGTSESTDITGELLIPLPDSNLWAGDIGWLIVTNSDGRPATIHKAFSGPVAVL